MKPVPEINDLECYSSAVRKRKRGLENWADRDVPSTVQLRSDKSWFTNAAFSSTPKKLATAVRRQQSIPSKPSNAEIINKCYVNAGLEEKSISGLLHSKTSHSSHINEYDDVLTFGTSEIKPPSAKKKSCKMVDLADKCFENNALNIALPEKQFNPYEVIRTPLVNPPQCFVNKGLNLGASSATTNALNLFEVPRTITTVPSSEYDVSKHSGSSATSTIVPRTIVLPFTPTVGCRIDFKNMTTSDWKRQEQKGCSLDLFGNNEESIAVDIGKELDQYQLELENSINEAKMRRNQITPIPPDIPDYVQNTKTINSTIIWPQLSGGAERNGAFIHKLEEIIEIDEDNEIDDNFQAALKQHSQKLTIATKINQVEVSGHEHIPLHGTTQANDDHNSDDVASDSNSDEEVDDNVKPSTRFVRAYRRDNVVSTQPCGTTTEKSTAVCYEPKKSKQTGNSLVRKSIRKLFHPHHNKENEDTRKEINCANISEELFDRETEQIGPAYLLKSIRRSLRRKTTKFLRIEEDTGTEVNGENADDLKVEVSIIDGSERTLKLKSAVSQKLKHCCDVNVEVSSGIKSSLRSSLRKTTRGVRHKFTKSVFHREQEKYAMYK